MNKTFKKEKGRLGKRNLQICGVFFLHFVVIFNPQKLPTPIAINGTNERVACRFGYSNIRSGQKVTNFNFENEKRLKILQGQILNILIFIGTKNIF